MDIPRAPINRTFREILQLMRGGLLLGENLIEKFGNFGTTDGPCQAAEGLIQSDLVLFDLTAAENQRGVEKSRSVNVSDYFLTLGRYDANGFVFFGRGAAFQARENLFKAKDVAFSFNEVQIECLLQIVKRGSLDHPGQFF